MAKKEQEKSFEEVIDQLNANPEIGLTNNEAATRKEKYGPNEF